MEHAGEFGVISLDPGAFSMTDEDIQRVEMDSDIRQTPEFPYNWAYRPSGDQTEPKPFNMRIACEKLLIIFKDSGSTEYGRADIYVDGEKVLTADPLKVGWTRGDAVIILDDAKESEHEISVRMARGDEGKSFTILGFGVVR